MNIGYYPGCSLTSSAREYDLSLRKVLKQLGVKLEELDDWSCCGATSAHVTNHLLGSALAMRNLGLASDQHYENLFAPCAACYNRLVVSQDEIIRHPEMSERIEDLVPGSTGGRVKVLSVLELFHRIGIDKIKANVKCELKDLKAACYYGCLLVRPAAITGFDDAEQPTSMEKIVESLGAEVIDWNYKVECCGAAHSVARRDIVVDLSKKIIDDAEIHGANLIVVACPMCHTNLDMRQKVMKRKYPAHKFIPVLYISEIVGLALGMAGKDLGINLHYVNFKLNKNFANNSVPM